MPEDQVPPSEMEAERQNVSTVRCRTKKDGTGRNRRTRSYQGDQKDGFRRPCSQRQTTISGGSKSCRDFSQNGYRLSIELGRFDPARMKDPEIHGEPVPERTAVRL